MRNVVKVAAAMQARQPKQFVSDAEVQTTNDTSPGTSPCCPCHTGRRFSITHALHNIPPFLAAPSVSFGLKSSPSPYLAIASVEVVYHHHRTPY